MFLYFSLHNISLCNIQENIYVMSVCEKSAKQWQLCAIIVELSAGRRHLCKASKLGQKIGKTRHSGLCKGRIQKKTILIF